MYPPVTLPVMVTQLKDPRRIEVDGFRRRNAGRSEVAYTSRRVQPYTVWHDGKVWHFFEEEADAINYLAHIRLNGEAPDG